MQISKSIIRRAQYYETDAMKIVHHANHVRWMEEARLNFFKEAGFDWREMEESTGIMIPVLFQSVEYIRKIRFDDEIEVSCCCDKFNGVKMSFSYEFIDRMTGMLVAKGVTKHGFVDADYNPIFLQERYNEGYSALSHTIVRES